jgi:hypothetical protein
MFRKKKITSEPVLPLKRTELINMKGRTRSIAMIKIKKLHIINTRESSFFNPVIRVILRPKS